LRLELHNCSSSILLLLYYIIILLPVLFLNNLFALEKTFLSFRLWIYLAADHFSFDKGVDTKKDPEYIRSNPMPYSNSFRVFDRIKRVIFVCVLLAAIDNNNSNNSSYPVTDFAYHNDSLQIKYDVFVSFRGTDIRQDFLSHLIEAFSQRHINAFVDNKIVKGDVLSEALIRAIEGSSISLIIFSQDYASSHWCLSELVKIVECRRTNGQIVLPIFYKVDPSHVRYQKGSYEHAFAKHQIRYSLSTMQIWRTALTEAANLSGFHSSTFRYVFAVMLFLQLFGMCLIYTFSMAQGRS